MNIKDVYNSKEVTFDLQNSLDDKIDKLTLMMSKLTALDNNQNKQFQPKIYQSRWRGKSSNYYDQNNYDQDKYQNRYRSTCGDRRTSFRGRCQYRQNYRGKTVICQ